MICLPTVYKKILSIYVYSQSNTPICISEISLSRLTYQNPIESPSHISENVLTNTSQPNSKSLQHNTSIPMFMLLITPTLSHNHLTTAQILFPTLNQPIKIILHMTY